MEPPLMKYDVRTGTIDFGKMYEWKMVAWISLRCALSQEEMWISSNADGVGAFDDVVFRQGDKTFMIQLKHKNEPRPLLEKDFLAPRRGDYSLLKYSDDIAKLNQTCINPNMTKSGIFDYLGAFDKIHFVLFANRSVKPCKFLEKISGDNVLTFLDTRNDANIYKIQMEKLSAAPSNSNYNNFYLLANQIHAKKLDFQIMKEIQKIAQQLDFKDFDAKRITDDFIKFVELWAKGLLGGYYCLTKRDILAKLSELFFRQFELKLDQEQFSIHNNQRANILWNKVIQDKTVTVIDFDDNILNFLLQCAGSKVKVVCKESKMFWADDLSEAEKNCFFQDQLHLKTCMLKIVGNCGKINLLDVYKSMWMNNEVPLLLVVSKACQYNGITSIVKLTNYSHKVIIVNKSEESLPLANCQEKTKHFETIQDLREEDRRQILNQEVRFQGRQSVVLKNLIDENIFHHIKCSDIISILLGCFNIGDKLNALPPYFIHRCVSKVFLKLDVLEKVQNEIFLIDENSEDYLRNLSMNYIKAHSPQDVYFNALNDCHVIIIQKSPSVKQREKLKSLKKIIHCVALHDTNHLEWKTSYGSTNSLKRFYVELEGVSESYVAKKFICPTNIVSASPGMGKSILLDYVAQQAPMNKWILRVDLNGHQQYYQSENCNTLTQAAKHIQYFKNSLLKQSDCNTELNNAIFQKLANTKDVIVLLDGFDEVSPYYKDAVTNIAKSLHEEEYSVWLTTRAHLKSHLEKELNTFSITLKAFSREDQKQFLIKYFGANPDTTLVNEYVEQLLEAAKNNLNDEDAEFTVVPLQTKLLADVFEDDCKMYLSSNGVNKFNTKFDLLYLYENFIKKKIDIQRIRFGAAAEDVFTMSKEHQSRFALLLLFRLEDDLLTDIKKGLEDYYSCKSDKIQVLQRFGLITVEQNEQSLNVKFVHRTFGEFLAAQWLAENFNGSEERPKEIARILIKERFSKDYKFLFNLFDRLVCNNCPLHLAIANRDTHEAVRIMDSDTDQITKVDACGRSVLHLTALYGVEFPQLFELHEISLTSESQRFVHYEEYNLDEILNIIKKIPKNQLLKTDTDILGYSPLDYALANRSLHVAEQICENFTPSSITSNVIEMDLKRDYLGYCAILDYKSLINVLLEYFAFTDVLLWKTKYPYQRPLKFYKKLDYKSIIKNYQYYFQKVFDDIAMYSSYGLYKNYASNIKKYKIKTDSKYATVDWNNSCYFSLCHAIGFDCKRDIDTLKLKQSEVNKQDGYRITPIHYSVLCKNKEILNILLSKSANVNRQDVVGNTPLHLAVTCNGRKLCPNNKDCEETHLKIVTKLLSHGSNINLQNKEGDSPTHIALRARNFNLAKLLISNNADVKLGNNKGKTIIHLTAEYGNCDILKEILHRKVDLNKQDNYGKTPLFYAVANNSDMVKLLISKGSNVNIKDKYGETVHDIAKNQGLSKIRDLLINFTKQDEDSDIDSDIEVIDNDETSRTTLSEKVDLSKQDEYDNTFLFDAVRNENANTVKRLISNCANVNLENKKGQTILHLAAKHRSHYILNEILRGDILIDKQDNDGWTPLFYAVYSNKNTATWLIYKGANVNLRDKKGRNVLHLAAKNNFVFILKELLKESINIDEQDSNGRTPLFYAVRNNNEHTTKLLILSGASVKLPDKHGQNVLHLAAKNSSHDILTEILSKDIDIDEEDDDGWSPLFYAIDSNNVNATELLILNEANVMLTNKRGENVLHLAAKNGSYYVLNELLSRGVNIHKRTEDGWTPLFYAVFHNHVDSVKLLISNGSDININDNNDETVIDVARERGFDGVLKVLLKYTKHNNNENDTKCTVS